MTFADLLSFGAVSPPVLAVLTILGLVLLVLIARAIFRFLAH
jgi:hypothetical protein